MPGISRSGSTIAAGMARQVQREAAARFSFLLSTPVIFGAGMFKLLDLISAGVLDELIGALCVGFIVAVVSGYLCIRWLLNYLSHRTLYVFAVYCLLFGLFNLVVALVRE
jgi:undecaprenyl-diphosphatase